MAAFGNTLLGWGGKPLDSGSALGYNPFTVDFDCQNSAVSVNMGDVEEGLNEIEANLCFRGGFFMVFLAGSFSGGNFLALLDGMDGVAILSLPWILTAEDLSGNFAVVTISG